MVTGRSCYFPHQEGPHQVAMLPHSADRTVLQVMELKYADGGLTADRDQPTPVSPSP